MKVRIKDNDNKAHVYTMLIFLLNQSIIKNSKIPYDIKNTETDRILSMLYIESIVNKQIYKKRFYSSLFFLFLLVA